VGGGLGNYSDIGGPRRRGSRQRACQEERWDIRIDDDVALVGDERCVGNDFVDLARPAFADDDVVDRQSRKLGHALRAEEGSVVKRGGMRMVPV